MCNCRLSTNFAFVASTAITATSFRKWSTEELVNVRHTAVPLRHVRRIQVPPNVTKQRGKTKNMKGPRAQIEGGGEVGFIWKVGTSQASTVVDAVSEAARKAVLGFAQRKVTVTFALVFVSSTFETTAKDEQRRVVPTLKRVLAMLGVLTPDFALCGCTTSAGLGNESADPVVTVALAHIPMTSINDKSGTTYSSTVRTVRVTSDDISLDWKPEQWHEKIGLPFSQETASAAPAEDGELHRMFLTLYHPDFKQHTRDLLSGLDFAYPGVRKAGAEAGRVNPLHETCLFDADGIIDDGALILVIASRDVQVDVSVAQGARSVGPLVEVLAVRDDTEITSIREVATAGQTTAAPMTLFDMWVRTDIISLEDSRLAAKYLLFGTEVRDPAAEASIAAAAAASSISKNNDENISIGAAGGISSSTNPIVLLSRRVVGFNEATRSLGVEGDPVRIGTTAQFQIRDEEAARAELARLFDRLQLEASSKAMDGMSLMGALLLVDAERGAALHGNVVPDLDRAMYNERFPVPLATMTSHGQIGPLPSGGLLGNAGDSFMLSVSALYISIYGRVRDPVAGSNKESSTQ